VETLKRGSVIALVLLAVLAGSAGAQQGGGIIYFQTNLDYYLLNYFNRVSPMPNYGGAFDNHYSFTNLYVPNFYFPSHNFDFSGVERNTRTGGMGGAGVAFARGGSSLGINPAGVCRARKNEVYFGAAIRFGTGSGNLLGEYIFDTGFSGEIRPNEVTPDIRFAERHDGLYLAVQPFYKRQKADGSRDVLGRTTLAAGYRRFVEINSSENQIVRWIPTDASGAFDDLENLKSAAQSVERGGIDAVTVGLSTGLGEDDDAVSLSVGGAMNLVNGRTRAEQEFTVTQLTQVRFRTGGGYINQKFKSTAFDFGAQASVFGGAIRLGGTMRPAYTLEMPGGRYRQLEPAPLIGVFVSEGSISGYDMEMPSMLKVGGALKLSSFIGDGETREGALGIVHRFFGRGTIAGDYMTTKLSEATIVQHSDSLANPGLQEQFDMINLFLQDAGLGDEYLKTTMPLVSGSALLRDQTAIRVGFETILKRTARMQLRMRLGFETVPYSFPSLVTRDVENTDGTVRRDVVFKTDGTPRLEDVEGDAYTFGLGVVTGNVNFDLSVRRQSVDFVQYYEGTGPESWYNPFNQGIYEPIDTAATVAAFQVRQKLTALQVSAALAF